MRRVSRSATTSERSTSRAPSSVFSPKRTHDGGEQFVLGTDQPEHRAVADTRCGGNVANRRAFIAVDARTPPEPPHGCGRPCRRYRYRQSSPGWPVGGDERGGLTQLGVGRAPRGQALQHDAAQQRSPLGRLPRCAATHLDRPAAWSARSDRPTRGDRRQSARSRPNAQLAASDTSPPIRSWADAASSR